MGEGSTKIFIFINYLFKLFLYSSNLSCYYHSVSQDCCQPCWVEGGGGRGWGGGGRQRRFEDSLSFIIISFTACCAIMLNSLHITDTGSV